MKSCARMSTSELGVGSTLIPPPPTWHYLDSAWRLEFPVAARSRSTVDPSAEINVMKEAKDNAFRYVVAIDVARLPDEATGSTPNSEARSEAGRVWISTSFEELAQLTKCVDDALAACRSPLFRRIRRLVP